MTGGSGQRWMCETANTVNPFDLLLADRENGFKIWAKCNYRKSFLIGQILLSFIYLFFRSLSLPFVFIWKTSNMCRRRYRKIWLSIHSIQLAGCLSFFICNGVISMWRIRWKFESIDCHLTFKFWFSPHRLKIWIIFFYFDNTRANALPSNLLFIYSPIVWHRWKNRLILIESHHNNSTKVVTHLIYSRITFNTTRQIRWVISLFISKKIHQL